MEVLTGKEYKGLIHQVLKQKRTIQELCIKLAVNYCGSFRSEPGCIIDSNLNKKKISSCDGCPALSSCTYKFKLFTKNKNKN